MDDTEMKIMLARIDERVGTVVKKLDAFEKKCEDVDTRVYRLEGWAKTVPVSAVVVVLLILGALIGMPLGTLGLF